MLGSQHFADTNEDIGLNDFIVKNDKLNQIIQAYNFLIISEEIEFESNQKIFENIKKSELIVVSFYDNHGGYFVFSFQQSNIIIKKKNLVYIKKLLAYNQGLNFYFLNNSKDIFNSCISIKYHEIESINSSSKEEEEIISFISNFYFKNKKREKIWRCILSATGSYLINHAYYKLTNDHVKNHRSSSENVKISIDDVIELRFLSKGSSFKTILCYHIEKEELFVIKKPVTNLDEIPKLMRRELKNYLHLRHPFLPKFFGTEEQIFASNDDPSYVVIEFINGRTLQSINQIGLKKEDKIRIIYGLMTVLNYLHQNHFIYRDLKPDNVMIDKNNTAILIDFDRMVSYDDIKNSENVLSDYSGYFMHAYAAPEVGNDPDYSYACDIFSLGQMIYYIIEGKPPIDVNLNNSFIEFPKLKNIFKKCTEISQKNRPSISELIKEFYQEFHLEYSLDDIQNIYIQDKNELKNKNEPGNKNDLIQDNATNDEIQSSSALRNSNQNSVVQIINSEKNNHETGVLSDFIIFINEFKSQKLKILNKYLNEQILNYDFLVVTNETTFDETPNIFENMKISKLIVVQYINEKNIFIIGFEKTIIIVEISSISSIYQLFTQNTVLNICFFPNSKNYFDSYINCPYFEIDFNIFLREEITQFSRSLYINHSTRSINKVWRDLQYYISVYLLQSSYLKLNKNRIQNFISEKNISFQKDFEENDEYIVLRVIGRGAISSVSLAYSIKDGCLFAIKAPYSHYHEEQYLYSREISNYLEIKHPLIPKYYGRIKNGIAIEFINGNTLNNFVRMHLSKNDKLTIIFQLMLIIEFLHRNKFIYRVLKPDDVIIDENMTAVLIDFDRMIHIDNDEEHTCNFCSKFVAPEIVYKGYLSYKCDIYSLGQMIKYIFSDKNKFSGDEFDIKPIIQKCLCENPKERPSISELIFEFYSNYYSMINMEQMSDLMKETFDTLYDPNTAMILMNIHNIEKDSEISFNLGLIYHFSAIIPHDINKTIYYYTLSSNLNNPKAQYHLGVLYYEDEYLKRDIDKSIYYFKLAANQNHASAQYNLGVIYYEGRFIPFDIDQAISYLTLAANQNHLRAQFNLGIVYFRQNNIQYAIHYLTLAANQNDANAKFILSKIRSQGQYDDSLKISYS